MDLVPAVFGRDRSEGTVPARRVGTPMTPVELATVSQRFLGRPPAEVLAWAASRFAGRVVFATGFGAEGCVLVDLVARHQIAIDLVTIDTGLLFDETYALWRRLEERYGIVIRGLRPEQTVFQQAQAHGDRLWERDPDRCCALRKVAPLKKALVGRDAWITAIRRDQTRLRALANVVETEPVYGLVKINPLVTWTAADVASYVRTHGVPTNPLHERGYPSIGCMPCTSPVAHGEDPRAGRWRGLEKKECGLHVRPLAPPAAAEASVPASSEPTLGEPAAAPVEALEEQAS